jgi:peroxiredoxin
LRSFQDNLDKLTARGVRVVAVSVDPPDITQKLREQKGYTFLFLCDTQVKAIRRWDLLDPNGGIGGADIARPAEFLIDPAGTVRWTNFTEDYRVRVHTAAVLKVLDELHAGAPGGNH